MDILLGRFLDVAGASLDDDSRASLERLLERPDQEILDWIGGRAPLPAEPGLANVLERMRAMIRDSGIGR